MTIFKITLTVALGFASSASFADLHTKKAITHINFNQMIEDNEKHSEKLQQELAEEGFGARHAEKATDKQKVFDLIDAELGWGEAPQIGDRRFN